MVQIGNTNMCCHFWSKFGYMTPGAQRCDNIYSRAQKFLTEEIFSLGHVRGALCYVLTLHTTTTHNAAGCRQITHGKATLDLTK